jgi:hypothetical protein
MGYAEFKAPKGVIKVDLKSEGGRIAEISISGDFFMYPEDALERFERALVGVELERGKLLEAVRRFYAGGVQTPMVEPEHWVEAILRAAEGERK